MGIARAAVVGVLLIGQPAEAAAQAAKIELGTWEQFDTWLGAIEQHVPGTHDAAVSAMLGLGAGELESLFPYMVFALRSALGAEQRRADFDPFFDRYGTRGHAPTDTARLRERTHRIVAVGIDRFLKRAAMLHVDIAVFAPEAHLSIAAGLGHLARDGRTAGDAGRTWHWIVGRSLLHLVRTADQDSDVRLWYQAAGTYLLESHNIVEARPHLERAVEMFPRDAEIRFLLGFLHEALGSPALQAAVAEQLAMMPRVRGTIFQPAVRAADREHSDAVEAFAEAVRLDPDHHEARIRLGRALTLKGETDRAATELRAALAAVDHPTLMYLAQLFLARAEESRGRLAEARFAYGAAAALFPDAQSPRFALSQLDLQAGSREAARALFGYLTKAPEGDDPWWSYFRERVPGGAEWMKRLRVVFTQAVE